MNRMFALLCSLVLLIGTIPAGGAVETSASSLVLMDAASGRVLCQSNAHEPRLIASTTKLMTALVALESGHRLEEEVTIAPEWAGVEGSSLYLRPGETITLEALLYGMLLHSGNDAAVAVAGYCGGSVEAFVEQMNETAARLGMADSHFSNPNGLDAEDHYSTAYDMALLGRACLEQDTLRQMMAAKSVTFGGRVFTNHNKLLWRYEGCVGMKTGYTERAGRTLVSAAERDGMTLICVTLNDPNDWADHAALFDYGFEAYHLETGTQTGEVVGLLPVQGSLIPACPIVAGQQAEVCVSDGEALSREVVLGQTALEAPVAAGTQIGELVMRIDGTECIRVPLLTGVSCSDDLAPTRGLWERLLSGLTG